MRHHAYVSRDELRRGIVIIGKTVAKIHRFRGFIVNRLQTQFDPHEIFSVQRVEIADHIVGQAVRSGGDRDADDIGMLQNGLEFHAQIPDRRVSVRMALEICHVFGLRPFAR